MVTSGSCAARRSTPKPCRPKMREAYRGASRSTVRQNRWISCARLSATACRASSIPYLPLIGIDVVRLAIRQDQQQPALNALARQRGARVSDCRAHPRVPIRVERGNPTPNGGVRSLCEALQAHDRDILGPFTREGRDRVSIAEGVQRLAQHEERFSFNVDDALLTGNPTVGGGAHVYEQRDRKIPAGGAHGDIQPIVDDPACVSIGDCRHTGRDVQLRTVRLPVDPSPAGTNPLESSADAPHETTVTGEYRPRPNAGRRGGDRLPARLRLECGTRRIENPTRGT